MRFLTALLASVGAGAILTSGVLTPSPPTRIPHKHAYPGKGMTESLWVERTQKADDKAPCEHPSCEFEAHLNEKGEWDEHACDRYYVPKDSIERRGLVPCACFHEFDPCDPREVKRCKAYCSKELCHCCTPEGRAKRETEKLRREQQKKQKDRKKEK